MKKNKLKKVKDTNADITRLFAVGLIYYASKNPKQKKLLQEVFEDLLIKIKL
jgi:hypothetical protein